MKKICNNDPRDFTNKIVGDCTNGGSVCGAYKSKRRNNQYMEAVDLECRERNLVYAPFDGEISYYQPFGGTSPDRECADQGARIEGSGQWRGGWNQESLLSQFYLLTKL